MIEKYHKTVFVQIINFPHRKLILKRIKDEVESIYSTSASIIDSKEWNALASVNDALYEPVELWWPQSKPASYAFCYALGVEVPIQYMGDIPNGFEVVELPACSMMLFQANLLNHEDAFDIHKRIDEYVPEIYGYKWSDDIVPRIRLATEEYRGYIEARPVKSLFD